MIDFRQEVLKYKVVREMEDVEDVLKEDELLDMMDLLKKMCSDNKE